MERSQKKSYKSKGLEAGGKRKGGITGENEIKVDKKLK